MFSNPWNEIDKLWNSINNIKNGLNEIDKLWNSINNIKNGLNFIPDTITMIAGKIISGASDSAVSNVLEYLEGILGDGLEKTYEELKENFPIHSPDVSHTTTIGHASSKSIYKGKGAIPRYMSIGLGKIAVEIGRTEVLTGKNKIMHKISYDGSPISIPFGFNIHTLPIPIPTGKIIDYEFTIPVNFEKFGFSINKDITLPDIPFLEFNWIKLWFPLIAIPYKFEKKATTVMSLSPDPMEVYSINVGKIIKWFAKPRYFLGKHGKGQSLESLKGAPDNYIPDAEDIQNMINEAIR